jgi:ABC-type polysaccharide/polyol phosphate transport system ATPase subunit
MSPEGTINAHRIWKRFRADRQPTSLRERLERPLHRTRGWRWALRDVELSIEPGESVALIGANGSGKSTLLKILTGVMDPYAGTLEVHGRVGALIEVRTGIHPQLTGRQNVYVYGALIGMRRREVEQRFDEIVAFAEVEQAIDRPVKFYSSGMQMRLGFAVAAFLDPDVMLVDEVLAVGDASFQQRCLDKLREILDNGTTLVFVSHDLAAVEASCRRGLLLSNGDVLADGPVHSVLDQYRLAVETTARTESHVDTGPHRVRDASAGDPGGGPVRSDGPMSVRLTVDSDDERPAVTCIGVSEGTAAPVIVLRRDTTLRKGETELRCEIERVPLPRGRYSVWFGAFAARGGRDLVPWQPIADVDVHGPGLDPVPSGVVRLAPVHVQATWEDR